MSDAVLPALITGKWLIVFLLVGIALIFVICVSLSWPADPAFILHFVNCVLKPVRNVRLSVKNTLHIMLRVKLALMLAGNARKHVKRARNLLAAVDDLQSLQPVANRLPVMP